MKTVKIILIAALVLAVGLSFFACRKTEPAEPGPTEQTGPEITIVNEAVIPAASMASASTVVSV